MKIRKSDLLQKKFYNQLNENENAQFDHLLVSDAAFAAEYQMYRGVGAYLANQQLVDFREKLSNISQQYQQESKPRIVKMNQRQWYYVASVAAVILLFIGSYYFAGRNTSSEELFYQYYSTDNVYLNTRSGDITPAENLEKGLLLFESEKFKESIEFFEQMPNSITAVYYSGVAHMELGEYEVAIYKFDQVIQNYVNVFFDQSQWYKGLCLLKMEKNADAKAVFYKISHSNSFYNKQAMEVSSKLK